MDLMCRLELVKAQIEERYDLDFDRTFADELDDLEALAEDGLVVLHPDRIDVTPAGRMMIRNIASAFDTYLRTESSQRYSRAV
jgi:oxygen-independent coproporphyrinogen-3 oxidase